MQGCLPVELNSNLAKAGLKIFKNKLLGQSQPVIVAFSLTDLCNKDCVYCSCGDSDDLELTKNEVFESLGELKDLGTEIIKFTGGEPLIRQDIDEIVTFACNQGFWLSLNSNGSLVSEKKEVIKKLDNLNLSLEGKKEVHNKIRGAGSFGEVVSAIKIAKELGVGCSLRATVNKYNWDKIDDLLDLAEKFNCKISFQPILKTKLYSDEANPVFPQPGKIKRAFQYLIERKKQGDERIWNSLSNLIHLRHFPDPKEMHCDRISCYVDSQGVVKQCARNFSSGNLSLHENSFRRSFNCLEQVKCFDCWCEGRAALSQIFYLDINSILNYALS